MEQVVDLIDRALQNHENEKVLVAIGKEVHAMMAHRPLFVV
jgi:glycine/serine hydroxymethyltransferase